MKVNLVVPAKNSSVIEIQAFDCVSNQMKTVEVSYKTLQAKRLDCGTKWEIYQDSIQSEPGVLLTIEGQQSGLTLYSVIKQFEAIKPKVGRYEVDLKSGDFRIVKDVFSTQRKKLVALSCASGFVVALVIYGLVDGFGAMKSQGLVDSSGAGAVETSSTAIDATIEISPEGKVAGLTGDEVEKLKVAAFLASMTKPEFDRYVEGKSTGDAATDIQNFTYLASLRATGLAINQAGGLDQATVGAPVQSQASQAPMHAIALSGTGKQGGISVFADPQCPACQHYEKILEDELGDRAITIYPVAILEGSDYIVDQIMCSADPAKSWMYFMKNKKLMAEVSVQGCASAFSHEKNLEIFSSAGLTKTPSSIFESIPEKAIVGSVIPDKVEKDNQLAKK